jgi:hypothetical protein
MEGPETYQKCSADTQQDAADAIEYPNGTTSSVWQDSLSKTSNCTTYHHEVLPGIIHQPELPTPKEFHNGFQEAPKHSQPEPPILEPIAVVGMAYKFPQGASSDAAFWKMLLEKRCATTEFPADRMNIDAFHSIDPKRLNRISTRKAHFLEEDIRNFDAGFFNVPPHEAGPMDPQHRMLLETTYHALENGTCGWIEAYTLRR